MNPRNFVSFLERFSLGFRSVTAFIALFAVVFVLCGPRSSEAALTATPIVGSPQAGEYGWTGLIRSQHSDGGYTGSGSVIYHPKIVLSCAHVAFDDVTNTMSNTNYWFLNWNQSALPSTSQGVPLRGRWYFIGYIPKAELQINSNSAFARDFVCYYSYSPLANGGYGGTWLGDAYGVLRDGNKWKKVTGYPAGNYAPGRDYRMHVTGPWHYGSFEPTPDPDYLTITGVTGGPGMSGGPVWVSNGDSSGPYFFSGVLVSGNANKFDDLLMGVKTMNPACWSLVDSAIGSTRTWQNSKIGTVSNVSPGERMAVYNPNWNHVYYRGTDGRIWVCYCPGGTWVSAPLGTQSNVAGSLAFNPNWNHVYYKGTDGGIWVCLVINGSWVNIPLGTAKNVRGELIYNTNWNHVYYQAVDGSPWACFFYNGTWISQPLVSSNSGGSWAFNPAYNQILNRSPVTGGLGAAYALPNFWVNVPFGTQANVSSVAADSFVESSRIAVNRNWNTIFYQGNDNQLWAAYIRSGSWYQDRLGGVIGGPMVANTKFNVVQYLGQDGNIWAGQPGSNGWVHNVLGNNANVTAPLVFGSQWNHVYYRGTDGNMWALHFD